MLFHHPHFIPFYQLMKLNLLQGAFNNNNDNLFNNQNNNNNNNKNNNLFLISVPM